MNPPCRRDSVRVASIPAAHPYVTALGLEAVGVELLPDPRPPGAPPGRWWPPVMLDPRWITAHARDFDVMHVHFGMESRSVAVLRDAVAALRAAGRPLVHTVHDLTHPQLADQARHRAQLEVIVPAADRLITLTRGAAAEIERRWGRSALVIPHPAMAASPSAPVGLGGPPRVGVHLRDLRPGIDGPGTIGVLGEALAALTRSGIEARGTVWMHDRVRDPAAAGEVRRRCAASPALELAVGPRPGDAALARELGGVAVELLPYRHGTHSGWLELCWDLGVPVALPAVGHLADQHPEPGFRRAFTPGDAASLARALAALLESPPARAGSPARHAAQRWRAAGRSRERPRIGAAHRDVYREVCAI